MLEATIDLNLCNNFTGIFCMTDINIQRQWNNVYQDRYPYTYTNLSADREWFIYL